MHDFEPISEQADRLLGITPQDQSRPHYTDAAFARKLRLARRRASGLEPGPGPLAEPVLYLQLSDLGRVMRSASLTPRQVEVLTARVAGDTWREIGLRHGQTKQGALHVFKQALRKLKRAWRRNPFRGLPQVYRHEVSRFAPPRIGRSR